jgi:hypothetical protein
MSDLKNAGHQKSASQHHKKHFTYILHKDLKTVQPRVDRLREEGFIKLEPGSKKAKKSVVNF